MPDYHLRLHFPASDLEVIRGQRLNHPHPRIRRKLEVLWLRHKGEGPDSIATLTELSRSTVQRYLSEYHYGGLRTTLQLPFAIPTSDLNDHLDLLREHFRKHPPRTAREAQQAIRQLTGLQRGLTQVRHFLRTALGMNWRKVGLLPAKPDPDAQSEFLHKEMQPRLRQAQLGEREVWFVDAAHFIFAAVLGYVWCVRRLFLPSPAGRQRFNVLAAVNVVTREVRYVAGVEGVRERTFVALLKRLTRFPDGVPEGELPGVPITLVLDNARYFKTTLAILGAKWLGIELLFLPPYSPNLNLIERVWKFVRGQALGSTHHESFAGFQAAITGCLDEARGTHRQALTSLLAPNFQTFEHVSSLAA